ncbi:MAG: hypothetical protein EA425_12510 [Puniceicoccaceae bacterium]|nr:MAG: hypothetical protein EA425_12510 [Puniceicoccaceae bacterium]
MVTMPRRIFAAFALGAAFLLPAGPGLLASAGVNFNNLTEGSPLLADSDGTLLPVGSLVRIGYLVPDAAPDALISGASVEAAS